jgi:hypothetical protein
MRTNYVLIDLQNVPQEADLVSGLGRDQFKLLLFFGSEQKKLLEKTTARLEQMGVNAEAIMISGHGRNALDFHIAYYIGEYARGDRSARFHIVAKDKGYDPLIHHLNTKKGVIARRVKSVARIQAKNCTESQSLAMQLEPVVKRLLAPTTTRPTTRKKLENWIVSQFPHQFSDSTAPGVVQELERCKHIFIKEENVTYVPTCES